MGDAEEHEVFPEVRSGPDDPKDRIYPPPMPDAAVRARRPKELFLEQVFGRHIDPLPARVDYDYYRSRAEPTQLQRGEECTGFALAAIADHHLRRGYTRDEWAAMSATTRGELTTSRRMLYEIAQELDDADYRTGSTLRGALKGWKRLGVASAALWPYHPDDESGQVHGRLTLRRVFDAYRRPGGPYYRIDPTEIGLMQDALARELPLYALARQHVGWYRLYLAGTDGVIHKRDEDEVQGGHAFVIVGYDERGFWIHNSWGAQWGLDGYGLLPYDDWTARAIQVWCVIPPRGPRPAVRPDPQPAPGEIAATRSEMWRHVVTLADDGRVARSGAYRMEDADIKTRLYLFGEATRDWEHRRLAVIADGGLSTPEATLEHLRPFRDRLLANEIYPIFLVWDTPWLADTEAWLFGELAADTEVAGLGLGGLQEMWAERGGVVTARVAFAESIAPRVWHELRRRAVLACRDTGGASKLAESIRYKWGQKPFDIHLIAHGAGDLLLSRLAPSLPSPLTSCDLWAPLTTTADFRTGYEEWLGDGRLRHLTVTTLDDEAEGRDSFGPMPESLPMLVADVLAVPALDLDEAVGLPDGADDDEEPVWRIAPEPILGIARFAAADAGIGRLRDRGVLDLQKVSSATHVSLATDRDLQERAIRAILARPSVVPEETRRREASPPPVEPPPARDPLARAIAALAARTAPPPG